MLVGWLGSRSGLHLQMHHAFVAANLTAVFVETFFTVFVAAVPERKHVQLKYLTQCLS